MCTPQLIHDSPEKDPFGTPESCEDVSGLLEKIGDLKRQLCSVVQEGHRKQGRVDELKGRLEELGRGEEEVRRKVRSDGWVWKPSEKEISGEDLLPGNFTHIWDKVFAKLDTNSLLNVYRTCQHFKRILEPTKETWLFEKVFPHIILEMDTSSVLSCRSAGKTWMGVVDKYFGNHWSYQPHSDSNYNPRQPLFLTYQEKERLNLYYFNNSEGALYQKEFTSKMRSHPRSPFIGKALQIEYKSQVYRNPLDLEANAEREAEQTAFWTAVEDFISTFGSHLDHLRFAFSDWISSTLQRETLHKLLTQDFFYHLPNLKKLEIGGFLLNYENRFVDFNSIESAPNLESLELKCLMVNPNYRNALFVAYCQKFSTQLKKLHLPVINCISFMSGLEWPNLVELSIFDFGQVLQLPQPLQHYLPRLPQLRKLSLGITKFQSCRPTLQRILEIVNILSENSPHFHILRLTFQIVFDMQDLSTTLSSHLVAPKQLTSLEIENEETNIVSKPHNYYYLLRFPFVKHLAINILGWNEFLKYFQDSELNEIVELNSLGAKRDLYMSNVWELMPSLENFRFQDDLYTLNGYKMHLKKL